MVWGSLASPRASLLLVIVVVASVPLPGRFRVHLRVLGLGHVSPQHLELSLHTGNLPLFRAQSGVEYSQHGKQEGPSLWAALLSIEGQGENMATGQVGAIHTEAASNSTESVAGL